LGIIFILEIAVGIAAIAFHNDLKDILNTQLQKSMARQNKVSKKQLYFTLKSERVIIIQKFNCLT
jgi:hypothetical protein